MTFAVKAFFTAFRNALSHDEQLRSVRLHFIGTDYAAHDRARPSIRPIADEVGIGEFVEEIPQRIPYGETLRCLLEADALIMPGSDDPGYTASKIYPYVLARKPMLTIFRRESSVAEVVAATRCAQSALFDARTSPEQLCAEIERTWFASQAYRRAPDTNWPAFQPYTAEAMTARLAQFFDRILAAH